MAGTWSAFVAAVAVVWSLVVTPVPFVGVFSRVEWSSLPMMMLFALLGTITQRQARLTAAASHGQQT